MIFLKKTLKSVFTATVAGMLLFGAAVSSAADTPVTDIKTDTVVSGTLTKDQKDPRFYKFVAPEDGYFDLVFTNKAADAGKSPIRVELFKGDTKHIFMRHEGGSRNFKSLGAKKDSVYYIGVDLVYSDTTSVGYDFNVKYTKADDWENEINDDQANAREIAVNKEYKGSINGLTFVGAGEADKEMYVFTAPDRGYFTVDLNHADVAEHGTYELEVLDENANQLYYGRQYEWFSTRRLSAAKGQKFYISMDNASDSDNQIYKLKVNFTATDAFELENNGDSKNATEITLGKEYSAVSNNFPDSDHQDADFFKFTLDAYSNVTLDIANDDVTCKEDFNAMIYNEAGDESYLSDGKVSDKVSAMLGKGTYYIKVEHNTSAAIDYKFKVSAKPVKNKKLQLKSVDIKKLSGNKYSVSSAVINKKDSKANGYSISISDNKDMKKSKSGAFSGSKALKAKKALKIKSKKKTFYVTVSPRYKDIFGKTVNGPVSKIKVVNVK